ncbi:MAG TPA: hypothetical protein PLH57_02760, partial [Oligoflexia bacterium]|nr:hypothetical protein [Oligoflexia bacterium]
AIIEKQVRKNIDSKYFIDSDARLKEQGVPYLRGETVDVRFYPAAKSIGVSACAMDINDLLKAYLKGDTKPLETSFWWKGFSQHQEFRPLCIRVDLPVLDFDPTKVDLKSEFKKRLESAISEVSAWTPPPAYYDSLEKYLDHVLPKVCRPKSVESTEVSITPEPVETQAAGETPVDEATPNQGEQPTQDSSETGETSDNSSGDDVDL